MKDKPVLNGIQTRASRPNKFLSKAKAKELKLPWKQKQIWELEQGGMPTQAGTPVKTWKQSQT